LTKLVEKKILIDNVSNIARARAHYLQLSTRSAVTQVRVPIRGVFLKDVMELEAC
jgi:hypothetical protein